MRTGSLLLAALALIAAAMLVAAGCTTTPPTNQTTPATTAPAGNTTPTVNATVNATPTVNATVNVTPVANITAPFVNATWRWIARSGSESIQVSSPAQYTIAFNKTGTYSIKADCNNGTGNFTVNGTKVKIMPANLTTKYCGDQSLDKKFTTSLYQVTGYEMDAQGRLVLVMVSNNERLTFTKAA
jgi:heat shock protein HslJ